MFHEWIQQTSRVVAIMNDDAQAPVLNKDVDDIIPCPIRIFEFSIEDSLIDDLQRHQDTLSGDHVEGGHIGHRSRRGKHRDAHTKCSHFLNLTHV